MRLTIFHFAQFGSMYPLPITRRGLALDALGWHLPPETGYGLQLARCRPSFAIGEAAGLRDTSPHRPRHPF